MPEFKDLFNFVSEIFDLNTIDNWICDGIYKRKRQKKQIFDRRQVWNETKRQRRTQRHN